MIAFHGLNLKNPVVAASSPATETLANVKRCAQCGCGAVILKSTAPAGMVRNTTFSPRRMFWQDKVLYMLSSLRREFMSCEAGELLVTESKNEVEIPIIASAAGSLEDKAAWLAHSTACRMQVRICFSSTHSTRYPQRRRIYQR